MLLQKAMVEAGASPENIAKVSSFYFNLYLRSFDLFKLLTGFEGDGVPREGIADPDGRLRRRARLRRRRGRRRIRRRRQGPQL